MSFRSIRNRLVAVLSLGVIALSGVYFLERLGAIPFETAPSIIYTVIVLLIGVWLVSIISGFILRALQPTVGPRAYAVRNFVQITGYIILGFAALSVVGVSPVVALAGGTVGGLVIGLGAQLVLSNFFAGIVIIITGFIKVGDEIRLLTGQLPYAPANQPAYKYFSPDYINYGYRGRVVEVGLVSSSLITDTGLGLRVPNQIIFNSAIIDYRPAQSGFRTLQVRYEFSISFEPNQVLRRVKEALKDVNGVEKIYFNEQSDKQFLIVLVEFQVPIEEDWSLLKSEILVRLAGVQRALQPEMTSSEAPLDSR